MCYVITINENISGDVTRCFVHMENDIYDGYIDFVCKAFKMFGYPLRHDQVESYIREYEDSFICEK